MELIIVKYSYFERNNVIYFTEYYLSTYIYLHKQKER